jgi:hypothetical protein
MVTSYKMNENEIGYRGSKSDIIQNPHKIEFSVKEQRVDGSWFLKKINIAVPFRNLRCTLMDFERNYQIKILSKQLNKLFYSTVNNIKLNP